MDRLIVQCNNIGCKKIIDVREKEIHLKIYHPNYRSLIFTENNYPNIDRYMTPKEIVKSLFMEIKNNNADLEGSNEI